MNKREFLKTAGFASLGLAILPLYQCQTTKEPDEVEEEKEIFGPFTLPELGFSYRALEPEFDSETMKIHHSKHHAGYVEKLNKAIDGTQFKDQSLQEILHAVTKKENHIDIRNNAGGHYNHTLYWEILLPGGSKEPQGELLEQIHADFGSFEAFIEEFSKMASGVFGSGWTWLCVDAKKKLFIMNTENQDNPLMNKIVKKKGTPILAIDVWEHAYYLNYRNERKSYITNFMKVINWDVVGLKFDQALNQ